VSFDKEFQQVADNIAHHSTEIDWAANAANIEEAKKARGFEDMVRQGKRFRKSYLIFSRAQTFIMRRSDPRRYSTMALALKRSRRPLST
jgi:hypothetical protein